VTIAVAAAIAETQTNRARGLTRHSALDCWNDNEAQLNQTCPEYIGDIAAFAVQVESELVKFLESVAEKVQYNQSRTLNLPVPLVETMLLCVSLVDGFRDFSFKKRVCGVPFLPPTVRSVTTPSQPLPNSLD
jgi:hypothetical protein